MTSPAINAFVYATITYSDVTSGATSTIKVCNRPLSNWTNEEVIGFYPIIDDLGDIGARTERAMPDLVSGAITLIDEVGTFGRYGKFSDLFDRYSIIGQQITLTYSAQGTNSTFITNTSGDAFNERVVVGAIKDVQRRRKKLTITFQSVPIPDRRMTKTITADEFPNAPESSLGVGLPIVFGDSPHDVAPVVIDDDNGDSIEWATVTNFHDQFAHPGGADSVWVQNVETADRIAGLNPWNLIEDSGSTTTPVLGYAIDGNAVRNGAISDTSWAAEGYAENLLNSGSYLSTNGYWYLMGKSATASDYTDKVVTFRLHLNDHLEALHDLNLYPGKVVAEASVDLADWSGSLTTTSSKVQIEFSWSRPVLLRDNNRYFLSVYADSDADGVVSDVVNSVVSHSDALYRKTNDRELDEGKKAWTKASGTSTRHYCGLWGVRIQTTAGSTTDSDGFRYGGFQLTQRAAATGQTNFGLGKLKLLARVYGIIDSSGGTITGSPFLALDNAYHAAQLLLREWNGSSWAASQLSTTVHSATHSQVTTPVGGASATSYTRGISGVSQYRDSRLRLLQEILEDSACFLAYSPDSTATPLIFSAWGYTWPEALEIYDDEILELDHTIQSQNTVTTRLDWAYDEALTFNVLGDADRIWDIRDPATVAWGNRNSEGNFRAKLKWDESIAGEIATRLADGVNVYGAKDANKGQFKFIGDSASMSAMARYYTSVFGKPREIVKVTVPQSEKFYDLRLFNVVRLNTALLPQYEGSSNNFRKPYDTASGTTYGTEGEPFRNVGSYRAQIISARHQFRQGSIPTMVFEMRLLNNYPEDPT